VPQSVYDRLDMVSVPEASWSGTAPTWRGVPCDVGRVTIWLPVQGHLVLRDLSLLALLPQSDPPDSLPYVLLGTQFLLEHRVTLRLDCGQPPGNGHLEVP
jgi:hypothetical protein